ncbi:GntR family transcriptional regulator [Phytoactinopolyspora limicola]|uniref:GntR family transcriptional regulator n=1 Tax=Phytoactinopolyspora limicola TaxID=2715536 RepID=UPI001409D2EC|nr:GntR family transcriptional regulator [Phytoactinopolyspora limicola]
MVIQRQTLRAQIRAELIERMNAGSLPPGEAINEVHLAAELGVSRTPLREALIALENEGLIQSEQGKGFRFSPVSAKEFEELCPVLAALEGLALELSPPEHLAEIAPQLLQEAREFSANVAEYGVITKYDDEWHDLLLSGCTNERLMDLITTLKLALRRYESVMVKDEQMIERAASEHQLIAERVAAGDIAGAIEALRTNWLNGMQRTLNNFAP